MSFWSRKKKPGVHRASPVVPPRLESDSESLSPPTPATPTASPPREALLPIPEETGTGDISAGEALPVLPSAREVTAALKREAHPLSVPRDSFSLLVYVALLDLPLSTEAQETYASQLKTCAQLEKRIEGLQMRIDKLTADVHVREHEFEDLRFEKHMDDVTTDDYDDAESEASTLDQVEEIPVKRELLKESVMLLASFELARTALCQELSEALQTVAESLPSATAPRLLEEIWERVESRKETLTSMENKATSDGEQARLQASEELASVDELVNALAVDGEVVVDHSSDSVFSIER